MTALETSAVSSHFVRTGCSKGDIGTAAAPAVHARRASGPLRLPLQTAMQSGTIAVAVQGAYLSCDRKQRTHGKTTTRAPTHQKKTDPPKETTAKADRTLRRNRVTDSQVGKKKTDSGAGSGLTLACFPHVRQENNRPTRSPTPRGVGSSMYM